MAGPRVVLQARDRLVLSALELLPCASQDQIRRFAGFGSRSRTSARLLQLVQAGYLGQEAVGTIRGGLRAVYFLPGRRPRGWRGPAGLEAALSHGLMLAEVFVASQMSGTVIGTPRALWQEVPDLGAAPIPDGALWLDGVAGGRLGFLEVDRGTEGGRIWHTKVDAYLALARRPDLPALLGCDRFGVLVVVPNSRRLAALRQVIAARTGKLFWLASLDQLSQHGFFAPIWFRPEGEGPVLPM